MFIEPIAHIENDLKEKFGIPRQSGLCDLQSKIVFEPKFRDKNAIRGIEDFTHLWLIWGFSEFDGKFSPTVRPPRLGGNVRKGVFATRSPNRPNPLGLSVVRLCEVCSDGALVVSGADLMNGTPIFDIKPYLPYADSVPEASNGWPLSEKSPFHGVNFPNDLTEKVPQNKRNSLIQILAQDPRPQYQNAPERIYTMSFAEFQVSFRVDGNALFVEKIE